MRLVSFHLGSLEPNPTFNARDDVYGRPSVTFCTERRIKTTFMEPKIKNYSRIHGNYVLSTVNFLVRNRNVIIVSDVLQT